MPCRRHGRRNVTVSARVEEMECIAPVGGSLGRYQPSQGYFLLDEGRLGKDDLPGRNVVSLLAGLENSRSTSALCEASSSSWGWLRDSGEEELRRAFAEWLGQMMPRRFGEEAAALVRALEGGGSMLAERMKEWTEQWLREGREQGLEQGLEQGREQGREQGIERGRAEERALLCRQASRKFDAETGARLSGLLERLTDPERLAEVGDWVIECGTGAELLDRTGRLALPS